MTPYLRSDGSVSSANAENAMHDNHSLAAIGIECRFQTYLAILSNGGASCRGAFRTFSAFFVSLEFRG